MSVLDIQKIVNGTPVKRLNNGYNKMKENYTAESAQEYFNIYSNEPLSFLLENSRKIFSEPYFGEAFYESIMTSSNCLFNSIEQEHEKVLEFVEENGQNMGDAQKSVYEKLVTFMESFMAQTKNTQIYTSYIKEHIDDRFEENLMKAVYAYESSEEKNDSEIVSLFEATENPIIFFTYAPYVSDKIDSVKFKELVENFCEKSSVPVDYNEDQWKTFVETVICCNKLTNDSVYKESVNNITARPVRMIFEYFMNTSLDKKLDELVEEHVSEDIHSVTRQSAINNIFMDIYEAEVDKDENDAFKNQIDTYKGIAYECTLDIIVHDYQRSSDTNEPATGYSILESDMSLDEAFESVNSKYTSSSVYMTEADDEEDVSDDDIENAEKDINNDEASNPTITDDRGVDAGKKSQAPKPKNLANKIQFKAMDAEAKQQRKRSIRAQKGQEITNAVNAVTAIPKNVITSIKGQVKQLDEKDDERRKDYMTEPGFRKKAFRNMKLAILYGTAAQAKLSFVPVVAICRHFSKQKDRRIRNELVREIETEIRVTEEKINDANANGDTKEKYKLIRIKDRLDAELVRVKVNSKYV